MSSSEPPQFPSQAGGFDNVDTETLFEQPKFQESLKFLGDTRFEATQPEIYPAFVQALSTFNQASPRSQEEADQNLRYLHEQVKVLLQGQYDLLERFEASLPLDYFQQRAKSEGRI
ncbi:hypothetical protein CTRI78_v005629 [Colletotrichum trifolii]|uniref:Uncharacterized protein n=1 Tax=Colletotrichum trifolii TaxID=5466 RepID=A0A4R8RE96_COLTR|nr:hypothetical protein CTRI78_v005629 [Colletotrichum trifolii]